MSNNRSLTITARNHTIDLASPCVMGIVNLTPDSFSNDGQLQKGNILKKNVTYAKKLIRQGADIIDIGGQSTRPGSERISVKEELNRVIPTIQALTQAKIKIPISIDTFQPEVAKQALEAGASIVNTIKGAQLTKKFAKIVAHYNAAIVLMHMQGTPKTMQKQVSYTNAIKEIKKKLKSSIQICLESGIKKNQVIIDPGIGFGKSVEHNLQIIKYLDKFSSLNMPILMGASRKSFIGKILEKDVNQRLAGSLATVCASIINGANIIRVHDVKETVDTIKILNAIESA